MQIKGLDFHALAAPLLRADPAPVAVWVYMELYGGHFPGAYVVLLCCNLIYDRIASLFFVVNTFAMQQALSGAYALWFTSMH